MQIQSVCCPRVSQHSMCICIYIGSRYSIALHDSYCMKYQHEGHCVTVISLLRQQTSCSPARIGLFVFSLCVKYLDVCVISCHVHTKQMSIIEVC